MTPPTHRVGVTDPNPTINISLPWAQGHATKKRRRRSLRLLMGAALIAIGLGLPVGLTCALAFNAPASATLAQAE